MYDMQLNRLDFWLSKVLFSLLCPVGWNKELIGEIFIYINKEYNIKNKRQLKCF